MSCERFSLFEGIGTSSLVAASLSVDDESLHSRINESRKRREDVMPAVHLQSHWIGRGRRFFDIDYIVLSIS